MHPNVDETPYDRVHLRASMVVFDMVYNPENTLLVKEARGHGCTVVTGVEMFVRTGEFAIPFVHGPRSAVGADARHAEARHRTGKDVKSVLMLLSLIGYRGSGKTTVAQLAALRLAWDWVDADVEIELRAGKSIAAIFADHGEEHFRDLESAVLDELLRRDRTVVALGGGIVLREANRQLLSAASREGRGRTAWLKASPETLWQRIVADATTAARRPNLTAGGGLEEVKMLLSRREPLYRRCADCIVETDGKSLAMVAEEVVGWWQESFGMPAGPGGHG